MNTPISQTHQGEKSLCEIETIMYTAKPAPNSKSKTMQRTPTTEANQSLMLVLFLHLYYNNSIYYISNNP